MKNPPNNRRRQLGISLVEMSIAAVVFSVLLVGILVGLPKLQLDLRMNKARQEIPLIINAMTAAYATQPNTAGASTQILSAANVWPESRILNRGLPAVQVNGVFPGSTERAFANAIAVQPRLGAANQGFSYWIHNIPKEACMPLVQLLVSQRAVVEVSVGAATLTPGGNRANTVVTTYANSSLAINMANATNACSTAGNKSVVAFLSRI